MSTWKIDQTHSIVGFKVKHLMVSTVTGEFKDFEGSIVSSDDSFLDAKVQFTAKIDSISTRNDMRDGHLKSADFFDSGAYPTISFVAKSSEKVDTGFKVVGDITMHGVTKEIMLDVLFGGIGHDMDGVTRVVGFDLAGELNRQDFGLKWNKVLETGGVTVADIVKLDIHVEAKEVKE
ncbi:MAG: YceI family protein [bacterium]